MGHVKVHGSPVCQILSAVVILKMTPMFMSVEAVYRYFMLYRSVAQVSSTLSVRLSPARFLITGPSNPSFVVRIIFIKCLCIPALFNFMILDVISP